MEEGLFCRGKSVLSSEERAEVMLNKHSDVHSQNSRQQGIEAQGYEDSIEALWKRRF